MLGPCEAIATSSWSLKAAMLGLEWRDNDLELTFNDCHAWPLQSHRDLKLALKAAMLGLEWRGNDLNLTLNDCHAWSPLSCRNLELAIEDGHAWS